MQQVEKAAHRFATALAEFRPAAIVSMVSGGKDSAASHAVLEELGVKPTLVIHGRTGCGIPQTTEWVQDTYGARCDLAVADAGTAYEDYVLRKGFFGKGIGAHAFAYRVLKAQPFRKVVSRLLRKRRRDFPILLVNGARKDESENRQKHLQPWRRDPAAPQNIWMNIIHDWSQEERDAYLEARQVPCNPVAKALCRSGECMCGTMQSASERWEAAALYPEWGQWLTDLETEARRRHGFGWGEPFPKQRNVCEPFQPMCKDCVDAQ